MGIVKLNLMYYQLMLAVESKYPGESRHDTALRYIREAEHREESSNQHKNNYAITSHVKKNKV